MADHAFVPLSGSQDTSGAYTRCGVHGCTLAPLQHAAATTGFREADHYGKTIQRLTTERDALRAEVELVREIVGAEEGEDTVAAVCWWLAERDHYERLAERYRAALLKAERRLRVDVGREPDSDTDRPGRREPISIMCRLCHALVPDRCRLVHEVSCPFAALAAEHRPDAGSCDCGHPGDPPGWVHLPDCPMYRPRNRDGELTARPDSGEGADA